MSPLFHAGNVSANEEYGAMATSKANQPATGNAGGQAGSGGPSIKSAGRGIRKNLLDLLAGLAGGTQKALEHQVQPVIARTSDHVDHVNHCQDFDEVVRRDMADLLARVADEVVALSTQDVDHLIFALRQAMSTLVSIRQDLHTNCNLYTLMYQRALADELANAQGQPPDPSAAPGTGGATARVQAIITATNSKTPRPAINAHKVISMPDLSRKKRQRAQLTQELLAVFKQIREVADQVALDCVHVERDHYVTLQGVIAKLENLTDYLKLREDYFRKTYNITAQ